ncbi:MAG TPA: cytochrome c-type biogenesis protein CcmH [Candidatus Limnocylindria bacterium]|nr:cytochrome c-type biogenesis protein CcmH [Candidatus Limnocylindria bacterium]
MTRWLPLAAALALAVAAVIVLVLLVQPAPPVTQEQQAAALAAELRCPDCESLSVAESRTAAATAIRAEISELLAAGRSPGDIRAAFVARYGEWILLQPTSPWIWLLPIVALLAGVALFGWWLLGRERPRRWPGTPALDAGATEAERQRIHDEVELLDG